MKALLEYIDSKKIEMFEFLEKLVNIDSGSYDKAGVDQVGGLVAKLTAQAATGENSPSRRVRHARSPSRVSRRR